MMKKIWPVVFCAAVLTAGALPAANAEGGPVVEDGKQVKVHYKLTVDGEVVDSSEGREPLEFQWGIGAVLPAFENELKGMKEGERKEFSLPPEEGYGVRDSNAVVAIPRTNLPEADIQVGMIFQTTVENQPLQGKVMAIEGDNVILDFNHPLADKTLDFEVEIVEIT